MHNSRGNFFGAVPLPLFSSVEGSLCRERVWTEGQSEYTVCTYLGINNCSLSTNMQ
jgi:hypothetical protein